MTMTTEDILQHAGVKGMKWGVRKDGKKPKREVKAFINTQTSQRKFNINDAMYGANTPAALAISVGTSMVKTSRAKKRIAKAFNSKPKDFNKKDLKVAAATVKNYTNVRLTSNGKTIDLKQSQIDRLDDILQHAGVKGMRWGVRKDGGKTSKPKTKSKSKPKSKPSFQKIMAKNMIKGYAAFTLVAIAPQIKKVGQSIARAAYNTATSDTTSRAVKNAVLSAKRSKFRVVDGSTLMNVINQKISLEDILQHHGVKGMKWGVIRSRSAKAAAKAGRKLKDNKAVNSVKEHLESSKRERSWVKVDVKGMSNQDIQKLAQRVQLENDLKRYSKSSSEKKQYRTRDKMSDSEIAETVIAHKAKAAFERSALSANKSQREIASAIVSTAAPIAIKYALTKDVSKKDVLSAVSDAAGPAVMKRVQDKMNKKDRTVSEAAGATAKSVVGSAMSSEGMQKIISKQVGKFI